jgi:diguanylate cyclase (GGDEF)-like protein/PAS domain S-box-containing protein
MTRIGRNKMGHVSVSDNACEIRADVSHYQLLARLVSDIILILDAETGRVIEANRAATRAFGIPDEKLRDLAIYDLVAPSEHREVPGRLIRLRKEAMSFETEMRRADGEVFPVEVSAESTSIRDRAVVVSVLRDITERRAVRAGLRAAHAELEQLFLAVPDGVVAIALDHTITRVNKRFADMLGRDPVELVGSKCDEVLKNAECPAAGCPLVRLANEESVAEWETVMRTANGEERWMLIASAPVRDVDGTLTGVVEVFKDITERKRAEEDLGIYRLLLEQAQDIILFIQMDGRVLDANDAAIKQYGYTREELLNLTVEDIRLPGTEQLHRAQMREAYEKGILFETVHRRKDGSTFPVEVSSRGVKTRGRAALLSIVRDITQRKRAEEEARYLSFHDKLTGLYNRAYFEEQLAHVHRNLLPCSIIVGDLNGLKVVNDAFGHAEGDRLLIEMSRILLASCRVDDVVSRTGGDEFAVILPNTEEQAAVAVAERIMRECKHSAHRPFAPSISLGVATKVSHEQEILDVFEEAERRMYRCKLIESDRIQTYGLHSLRQVLLDKGIETEEHRERLNRLMTLIARQMQVPESQIDDFRLFADLHDIGKVAIPDDIIRRVEPLGDEDREALRRHPEIGYRIARTAPQLASIAEWILSHHERWDGRGYPRRLKGDRIPLPARILAVAHAYDVMTDKAPHGKGWTPAAAAEALECESEKRFDPDVVQAFMALFRAGEVQ